MTRQQIAAYKAWETIRRNREREVRVRAAYKAHATMRIEREQAVGQVAAAYKAWATMWANAALGL